MLVLIPLRARQTLVTIYSLKTEKTFIFGELCHRGGFSSYTDRLGYSCLQKSQKKCREKKHETAGMWNQDLFKSHIYKEVLQHRL